MNIIIEAIIAKIELIPISNINANPPFLPNTKMLNKKNPANMPEQTLSAKENTPITWHCIGLILRFLPPLNSLT